MSNTTHLFPKNVTGYHVRDIYWGHRCTECNARWKNGKYTNEEFDGGHYHFGCLPYDELEKRTLQLTRDLQKRNAEFEEQLKKISK